jgi:hypothetical protein
LSATFTGPSAVSRIVIHAPSGSLLDTSALPRCRASDEDLRAQGAAACPPRTRVGGGTVAVDGGPPAGYTLNVFNGDGVQLVVAESSSPRVIAVGRTTIDGETYSVGLPTFPGQSAITNLRLSTDRIVRRGVAYARTPRACPQSGHWTFGLGFAYRDGATETLESQSPCRSAPPPPPPPSSGQPRIRIHGVPRGCASRRFVARIQITDRLRLVRAALLLDGRRLSAGARKIIDKTIDVPRLAAGRHRLTVTARDSEGRHNARTARFRVCG